MKKMASAFLAFALVCAGADMHNRKISADAANVDAHATIQVIVQWNVPVGSSTSQRIASLGGTVISEFKSVNQGVYLIPGSALTGLDADPNVKYVSADRQIHHKLAYTAAAINAAVA